MSEHIIQIRINDALYERAKRYFKRDQNKNYFAEDAFEKRVNFLEGRDSKLKQEELLKDAKRLQSIIDSGLVQIKEQ